LKTLLFALLAFCTTGGFAQRKQSGKPNIVIIFMDDMGYGDLECYGAVGYHTPNLNKLASMGMRFTNFYTPQATCTASRAALLTGCYPNRINMYGAFGPNQAIGLHTEEETIAEVLKRGGYATNMIGKWHLGNEPAFLPTRQGFDEYLGLPYSNDMWPVGYDGKPVPPDHPKARNYPPLPLLTATQKEPEPDTAMIIATLEDQAKLTTLYTERAVQFIRKNRKSPFFLYLAHAMTHVPIAASSKFKGKSKQGLFGDVMMEIDWSVGEIMKTLRELQLEKNTLVIFTSDNGPWLNYGNHNGSTAGLREGKGTSWEGGTRVPCIMQWPAVIPAGTVCNKLSSTIDVLPTISAVTNIAGPQRKIDGVNILPVLRGEDAEPRTEFYYYYNRNDLEAVRKGWWKLVFPHEYRSYENVLPGNDGYPGPYKRGVTDTLALYDLRRDPGERYNVINMYPDVVKQLQQLAEKARLDLGDNLTGREGENRRPGGKL
jgi:arylsulfatase A-like enzyme